MEMVFDHSHLHRSEIGESGLDNMNLIKAPMNTKLIIKTIQTNDRGMRDFLFTLGCYDGQSITVISKLSSTYVVNINDARYSIDEDLAKSIIV